jgi:peptidoglycan/xylan/chitin deacetylase (PgdA/CDA1 family)
VRGARRYALAALLLCALVAGAALTRRWIGHARFELMPVIVPPGEAATDVVAPPPARIVARMALDLRDRFRPPLRPRYAVLTFDDGPYPATTPALALELARLHVPADFFFIGRDAYDQPAIARRMADAGIEIGNHTLTHPQMPTLDDAAQRAEITGGASAIEAATGATPAYFRPPHGNFDARTIDAARSASETMALWDVDPGDWRPVTPAFIVATVLAQARSPAVILLHNGMQPTIDALPQIVTAYRRAGFEFTTLSGLQRALPLDAINDPLKVDVHS